MEQWQLCRVLEQTTSRGRVKVSVSRLFQVLQVSFETSFVPIFSDLLVSQIGRLLPCLVLGRLLYFGIDSRTNLLVTLILFLFGIRLQLHQTGIKL